MGNVKFDKFQQIYDEYDEFESDEEGDYQEKNRDEEFMQLEIQKDRKTVKGKGMKDDAQDPGTFTLLDGQYNPYKLLGGQFMKI